MTFETMCREFDGKLSSYFQGVGFTLVGPGIWQKRSDEISVVALQKRSDQPLMCINFGGHFSFVPRVGRDEECVGDSPIEIGECEIKIRITLQEAASDEWWPFTSECVEQMSCAVRARLPSLVELCALDTMSRVIRKAEAGDSVRLPSMTEVRTLLLLARIAEYKRDVGAALSLAKRGLAASGAAVGPRHQLRKLIARLGGG